ncbi:MAG: beta-ketoacyl-ACP synthase II [Chloroflexi bacterium]|nr:beta-ketoacyl-ACP synthase II [Chloroflexota bacterium]
MSSKPAAQDGRRIVVTGMGVATPVGIGVAATWEALINGRSGIDTISLFNPERVKVKIAAEVASFDPEQFMTRKRARHLDRYVQMAIAATLEAQEDAGLVIDDSNAHRVGVMIGTGIGGITTIENGIHDLVQKGPNKLNPFIVPMMLPNMGSGQVSIALGARGPNIASTTACSSGSDAIGIAMAALQRGEADVIFAGGAEAPICELGVGGFLAARALSTRNDEPQKASRPFDRDRDGFVMGEGAGTLVLETAEHARRRGGRVLAELSSYASVSDAYHVTQPAPGGKGAVQAMQTAIARAGVTPADVDYLNAHGTSTPLNDKTETLAVKQVFGESAYDLPISSTKSMIGHLMGASGAVEAVVCVKSITEGIVHPTSNLETPDPECDLDYVPHQSRAVAVRVALSNSMGFGGHNACLLFKRWEP